MNWFMLFPIYLCVMILAVAVGAIEAFVIGPFRGPHETIGGFIGIVMLFAGVPITAIVGIVFSVKHLFRKGE